MEGDIPTPGPQTSEPGPSTQADEKAESGELRVFLAGYVAWNIKNDVTWVLPSFGRKASPRMCVPFLFLTHFLCAFCKTTTLSDQIDLRVPQGRA